MKRKKLWLIPAVLALALLCACGAAKNAPSEPEENAEELSAETVNADSQEVQWYEVKGLSEENSSKNVG